MTKKIYISSDFTSNLWMFNLDSQNIKKIKKQFPQVEIEMINVDDDKLILNSETTIYWGTRINKNILKNLPNLKWIHFGSVGTDKINLKDTSYRQITVTNSKNINTYSIKNLILMYLFDINKKLLINKKPFISRAEYEKKFKLSQNIEKSKILICGYGNISKLLIKDLKNLKLNYDILSNQNLKSNKLKFHKYKSLNKIIEKYDIVINNLPLNSQTHEIFSNNTFSKLKKNVSIISIGRTETFHFSSLKNFYKGNLNATLYIDLAEKHLTSGKLSGINKLINVYVTPHIGGYTNFYWEKEIQLFIKNLKLFTRNKRLINIVNPNKNK